jgi:Leucine-rich repeat (LRR) protein
VHEENIEEVFLNFSPSTHIFPSIAETFPNLVILKISNQNIRSLQSTDFDGLRDLKILDLEANQIESLPQSVFWDLPQLDLLLLDNNRIKNLPETLFAANFKLRYLSLRSNLIERFPRDLFRRNSKLEIFKAYGNRRRVSGMDFTWCPNVKVFLDGEDFYYKRSVEYHADGRKARHQPKVTRTRSKVAIVCDSSSEEELYFSFELDD